MSLRAKDEPAIADRNIGIGGALRFARVGVTVVFVGTVGVGLFAIRSDTGNTGWLFHVLISLCALYLLLECLRYLRSSDSFGLLAPPFLASILHFYLAYIMPSTATLHDNWILDRFAEFFSSQPEQLAETVMYIMLAAFCMWRGYYLAMPLARSIRQRLQASDVLRSELVPALGPVLSFQVVYVMLVLLAIGLGIFGFASTSEARLRYVEFLDIISLALQAGTLSLFLLLAYVFKRSAQGQPVAMLKATCVVLIVLYIFVGAISGFKSQIVMPFVMLALAKFVATRKISASYILCGCVALIVAYQVIEPYRAYLGRNLVTGTTEVWALVDALQKSQEQIDLMHEVSIPLSTQIASRFDLTGMTAVGISAADDGLTTAGKGSEFAESLYLAPLLAWIPRAIWPDKPSYSSGVWFSNVVLGSADNTTTSVGMGPVAWFYMMGGVVGVAFGFLGVGVLQCMMFEGVARSGAGGLVIFLSVISILVTIPTDFGPALTGLLRVLPLAVLAQFILLRPTEPSRTIPQHATEVLSAYNNRRRLRL